MLNSYHIVCSYFFKSSSLQSLLARLEFPSELFLFQMAVSGRGSERDRPTGNVICCRRLVLGTAVMWTGESTRVFFFTRYFLFLSPLLFLIVYFSMKVIVKLLWQDHNRLLLFLSSPYSITVCHVNTQPNSQESGQMASLPPFIFLSRLSSL